MRESIKTSSWHDLAFMSVEGVKEAMALSRIEREDEREMLRMLGIKPSGDMSPLMRK